jgi:hypothetical protein
MRHLPSSGVLCCVSILCDILWCLFSLGKRASDGKSRLSRKYTAVDLEMKMRMTCEYGDGESLSGVAHELVFVSTVMKDAAHIKEHGNVVVRLICGHLCYLVQYCIADIFL